MKRYRTATATHV